MGKKKILLLFMASLQGWGHDISPLERPPFEQTILTKAAEKRIFSVDDAQRVRDIEAFVARMPKSKINLKSIISPVKNQGQRGACSNFAVMGLVEHFLDKNADYSEQCLAYFSNSKDSGTITEKLEYIHSAGMYLEIDCPYQKPENLNNWYFVDEKERVEIVLLARNTIPVLTNIEKLTPVFQVIQKHVDVLSDAEYLRYIQNQLGKNIPIGASMISVGNEWFDNNGMVVNIPSPEEIKKECEEKENTPTSLSVTHPFKKCSSHAVVLTGYDDAKKLIYFKNSWDEDWGLDKDMEIPSENSEPAGYGAFSYAYLTKFRVNSLVTLAR